MEKQNDNEYEIIDAKSGKLSKIGNDFKLFVGNMIDKIGEVPNFAKEILKSSEKSEENYNAFVKQDKQVIEMIIKQKLESGNYTDDELKDLLDRNEKITEKQEAVLDKLSKHKKEILLIVSGVMVVTLKNMLENRDNKA
ncbi:hypothetical protein [Caldibacillus thermoamylovorans]|uniref:hypothetical protein n=1 Tax=Caldibacillus thermoamylovorans TaxID=35841 RepID=UPI00203D56F3|nr:hypothetical protein [Caldibacillus thermoamylovorans]MCM3477275.1 hypothetical protein [Caldibacillus thermoamylovorans]